MKTKIVIKIISLIILTGAFVSCFNDLNTKPLDPRLFTSDVAYNSPDGYLQGLAKLYAALGISGQSGAASSEIANTDAGTSAFVRVLWYLQEMTTDECKWSQIGDVGTPELDYTTYGTINNPIISGLYYRLTFTVTLCNDFLKQTTDDKVNGRGHSEYLPLIKQYRAEARLIRALVYYYGLDVFGNMPFITENDPIGSYIPPQYTRKQLYDYIESELLALDNDPDMAEPRQNQYGRADKAAVWMVLSRLYLNSEIYLSDVDPGTGELVAKGPSHYDKCKEYAQKIIDQGGYSLCPNYPELFMADNGENPNARQEIIYAIRFDGKWTQSYAPYFLVCGSRGSNDASYTKTSGVKNANNGNRATLTFIRYFWPDIDNFITQGGGKVTDPAPAYIWNTGDPLGFAFAAQGTLGGAISQKDHRAIFFTRQCTLPMTKNAGASTFTYGWPSYKFTNITSQLTFPSYIDENGNDVVFEAEQQFPSFDFPLMRLAEAYLNYAEACVRISGGECTDAKALQVLNDLRDRAGVTADGNDHLTSFNLEYIFGERSRELYWEGFRRTDLIRWDRFAGIDYNWEFKNGTYPGTAVPYFRCLFPIPESDLGVNPKLKQNPGYYSN